MVRISSWDFLQKVLPIIGFTKNYDLHTALSDLISGITVGLTLIPQVIAYAGLADLEPQYGLYSSICGGFIYALSGTIPELNIAPTALLTLVTFTWTHNVTFGRVKAAIVLTFLAGMVELTCGIFHLGFLVDFVSIPVVAAFTSAGAVTIATSQIKNLLGLHYDAENFLSIWKNVFLHIGETRWGDAVLGFSCLAILLAMRKLKDYGAPPMSNSDSPKKAVPIYKRILWFLSVGRNALVVIGCAVLAFCLNNADKNPFALTSKVPSGFPNVSFPLMPLEIQNGTTNSTGLNTTTVSVIQMISEIGYGIVVIPFVAVIANVGIAKAFAHGKVVDASQEMIAVGLCNIVGAFFGSIPVNASFSRAAVSNQSGVRTPLSGIYTGIMVIMALTLLTPYFSYIPKSTLSAVIISAVLFLVEVEVAKLIWKIKKSDFIAFVVTFFACLIIGIELGILIGVLVEVLKLLYHSARPKVLMEEVLINSKLYLIVTPTTSMFFSSAEYVRDKVFQHLIDPASKVKYVLIDTSRMTSLDFTGAKCMAALVIDVKKMGIAISFLVPNDHIAQVLNKACQKQAEIFSSMGDWNKFLTGKPEPNGDIESVVSTQF